MQGSIIKYVNLFMQGLIIKYVNLFRGVDTNSLTTAFISEAMKPISSSPGNFDE